MGILLFFRKLFKIPNKEYRDLYRQYSRAEEDLDDHIRNIKPYQPLMDNVTYREREEPTIEKALSLFSPIRSPQPAYTGGGYRERINDMGLAVESYNTIVVLCQRAEKAYIERDLSSAQAIMDSLNELDIPDKAKDLQAYKKQLQTKIN